MLGYVFQTLGIFCIHYSVIHRTKKVGYIYYKYSTKIWQSYKAYFILRGCWSLFFIAQFSSLITYYSSLINHHLKYSTRLPSSLNTHHSIFFTLFMGSIPVTRYSFFFSSTQTHRTYLIKKKKKHQNWRPKSKKRNPELETEPNETRRKKRKKKKKKELKIEPSERRRKKKKEERKNWRPNLVKKKKKRKKKGKNWRPNQEKKGKKKLDWSKVAAELWLVGPMCV